jgi:hypothetical protein
MWRKVTWAFVVFVVNIKEVKYDQTKQIFG